MGRAILPAAAFQAALHRLKAGGTVESPTQLVEKPWSPHWAFITIGGPQAHPDSQDWLPHLGCLHGLVSLVAQDTYQSGFRNFDAVDSDQTLSLIHI